MAILRMVIRVISHHVHRSLDRNFVSSGSCSRLPVLLVVALWPYSFLAEYASTFLPIRHWCGEASPKPYCSAYDTYLGNANINSSIYTHA